MLIVGRASCRNVSKSDRRFSRAILVRLLVPLTYLASSLGAVLCFQLETPAQAPVLSSAEEILDKIRTRTSRIRTVHLTVEWEEYAQAPTGTAQKTRWEQQTIYADNLARIRIVSKKGTYDATGTRVPDDQAEQQQAFDGEKTIELNFSLNRDREGSLLRKSAVGKPGTGYRTAYIQSGLYPQPRGPAQIRNPLTLMDELLTFGVKEALKQKTPCSVTRNQGGTVEL